MSSHAHVPSVATVSSPPYVRRQCTAFRNPQTSYNRTRVDGVWVTEQVFHEPKRCQMPASPWLPEVAYCATHLPADSVVIVQQRMRTWNELNEDWWAEVLAEHPYREDAQ